MDQVLLATLSFILLVAVPIVVGVVRLVLRPGTKVTRKRHNGGGRDHMSRYTLVTQWRIWGIAIAAACAAMVVGCARTTQADRTTPQSQRVKPEAAHPSYRSRIVTLEDGVSVRDRPQARFQPGGVVALSDGGLCIFDNRSGEIARFSAEGRRMQTIGAAKPDSEGNRLWCQSLGLTPDGQLLLADTEGGVVRRFAQSGDLLATVMVADPAEWHFADSMGIAPDPAGGFYIADQRSDERLPVDPIVRRFSPSGDLLWERLLDRGDAARFPGSVGGFAVDPVGQLWAWLQGMPQDMGTNWCRRFRSNSDGVWRVDDVGTARAWGEIVAATFTANGERYELWFDTAAGYGTTLARFGRKFASSGECLWEINWPAVEGTGLAVDARQHVFVVFRDYKFVAPVCVEVDAQGREIRSLDLAGEGSDDLRPVPCPGP